MEGWRERGGGAASKYWLAIECNIGNMRNEGKCYGVVLRLRGNQHKTAVGNMVIRVYAVY